MWFIWKDFWRFDWFTDLFEKTTDDLTDLHILVSFSLTLIIASLFHCCAATYLSKVQSSTM